jgi:PRC-barrel domain
MPASISVLLAVERDMLDLRKVQGIKAAVGLLSFIMFAGLATSSGGPSVQAAQDGAGERALAEDNAQHLEHFPSDRIFRIIGKDVISATGETMGRIVDVLFDPSGKPCAALIDFGGFLGVGTRKIALDWGALRFDLGGKNNVIVLDLGREQLKAAPEYKESDQPIAVVTLPQLGTGQTSSDPVR